MPEDEGSFLSAGVEIVSVVGQGKYIVQMPFHLYRSLDFAVFMFALGFALLFRTQYVFDQKDLALLVSDGNRLSIDLAHTVDSAHTLVLVDNSVSLGVENHKLGVILPREKGHVRLVIEDTGDLAVNPDGFCFF